MRVYESTARPIRILPVYWKCSSCPDNSGNHCCTEGLFPTCTGVCVLSTNCKCNTGFYSATTLPPCSACPVNSGQNTVLATAVAQCECNVGYTGSGVQCVACAVGKYKTSSDSAACVDCEARMESVSGSSACTRQACNSTYAGLTTCAVLNDATALASDVANSTACRLLCYDWDCIALGRACTNTSEVMKPCFELCSQLITQCNPQTEHTKMARDCMAVSVPNGTQCFGNNGVLGMKCARRVLGRNCLFTLLWVRRFVFDYHGTPKPVPHVQLEALPEPGDVLPQSQDTHEALPGLSLYLAVVHATQTPPEPVYPGLHSHCATAQESTAFCPEFGGHSVDGGCDVRL